MPELDVKITLPYAAPPGLAAELAGDLGLVPTLLVPRFPEADAAYVLLATTLGVFFGQLAEGVGARGAAALKEALGRLRRPRDGGGRVYEVRIVDTRRQVKIVLDVEDATSLVAVTALVSLRLEALPLPVVLLWRDGAWRPAATPVRVPDGAEADSD